MTSACWKRPRPCFFYLCCSGTEPTVQWTESWIADTIRDAGEASDPSARLECLRMLRRVLTQDEDPPVDLCIDRGLVQIAARYLEAGVSSADVSDEHRLEAAWCISHLPAGTDSDHARAVLPVVPTLIPWLSNENAMLAEEAARAIGNLAADGAEFQVALADMGAIPALVQQMTRKPQSLAKVCSWAATNLLLHGTLPADPFLEADVLTAVQYWLRRSPMPEGSSGAAVDVEVAWLLAYLVGRNDSVCYSVVRSDLLGILLNLLGNADASVSLVTPVLRTLGNLAAMTDPSFADALMSHEAFVPGLIALLRGEGPAQHDTPAGDTPEEASHVTPMALRKEAMWVISGVAYPPGRAGDHAQAFMASGAGPLLAEQLEESFVAAKEAAIALAHIALARNVSQEEWEAETRRTQEAVASGQLVSPEPVPCFGAVLELPQVVPRMVFLLRAQDMEVLGTALDFVHAVLQHAPNGTRVVEEHDGIGALENMTIRLQHAEEGSPAVHMARVAHQLVDKFYGEEEAAAGDAAAAAPDGAAARETRGMDILPAWMKDQQQQQ